MLSRAEIAPGALHAAITSTAVTVLSFVFLSLKVSTRAKVQNRLGWDDGLAITAYVFTVPLAITIWKQAQNGMGLHSSTLSPEMLMTQNIWFWASIWLYVSAIGFAKLSVLTQYLRIFVGKKTKIATWAMIVIVIVYTIQGDLVGIFSCTPVNKFWNRPLPGTCVNAAVYYYITIAMNILTDIAVVVIPVPALMKLNIPTNQKYGLVFAFALGGFGCIISIVRLHAIKVSLTSPDPNLANSQPSLWSVVEVQVCIICACLPSLRPILVRIFPYASSFGSSNGRSGIGKRSQHHTTNRNWAQGNGINRLTSNSGSRHDSEQALHEIELSDTKSIKGGIQVVSTSEVHSERAPSGVSRSASIGSREGLARSPVPPDHWGYTVDVEASHK